MDKDKKLRMEVFAEGRRAFVTDAKCPYTDWRAGTWQKGRDQAASEYEAEKLAEKKLRERKRSDMPDYTDAEKIRAFDALWSQVGGTPAKFIRYKRVEVSPPRWVGATPNTAQYRDVAVSDFTFTFVGDVYTFKDVMHALATQEKSS